jgi:hypothetical protein
LVYLYGNQEAVLHHCHKVSGLCHFAFRDVELNSHSATGTIALDRRLNSWETGSEMDTIAHVGMNFRPPSRRRHGSIVYRAAVNN